MNNEQQKDYGLLSKTQLHNSKAPAVRQGLSLSNRGAHKTTLYFNLAILWAYAQTLGWEDANTGHQKLYKFFFRAASLGIPANMALMMAKKIVRRFKVRSRPCDFEPQLRNAYSQVGVNANSLIEGDTQPERTWRKAPEFSPEKLKAFVKGMPKITWGDLQKASPVVAETPKQYLEAIHGDDNVFITGNPMCPVPDYFWTDGHHSPVDIQSYHGVYFLINPITGMFVQSETSHSGESCRCEECISKFKYLLIESDISGYEQEWLQFLCSIGLPIVSIVSSGGKSLHALVRVDADTKEEWQQFKDRYVDYLVEHGADRAAMTAVRLSRLPFYVRGETGKLQELLYLDPNADGTPIISKLGGNS